MNVGDIVITPNGPGVITEIMTLTQSGELYYRVNDGFSWTRAMLKLPMRHYVLKLGVPVLRPGEGMVTECRYYFRWPEEFTPQVKALWESIQVVLLTDVPDGVRMEDEP